MCVGSEAKDVILVFFCGVIVDWLFVELLLNKEPRTIRPCVIDDSYYIVHDFIVACAML